MTRTLLVAGTASHVGKSTVAAGLCRHLDDRGVSVAPFKAQNMSNNARVALRPDGAWGEIGVSQYVQARAARVAPTTDMNPVLLKPRGDGESQLIVGGKPRGHYPAGEYFDDRWAEVREAVESSWRRLAADHDVIVAEGAGSIAEINLRDRDMANVETARLGDADILLLVDIERGGAFASLYGTLELMPADLRDRVVGAAITKFRGDRSILDPGIAEIEERTGVPVVGVVPYDDPGLPEEDSVALSEADGVFGTEDGVPDEEAVTVAIPRLPRISNFTDFEPLAREPGVRVAYRDPGEPIEADAVVLPGTKNTVDDLLVLREAGFPDRLSAFEGPVVGICGGYQMLGERITNAGIESAGDPEVESEGESGVVDGLGRLPVETRFSTDKRVDRVRREVEAGGGGLLAGVSGAVEGYEIHMGETEAVGEVDRPLGGDSAAAGHVLGTYLHGLFENPEVRRAFLDSVFRSAGTSVPEPAGDRESPYDRAAGLVREHLDLDALELPG
ncbi:MAG: cobyric acid synthase [Halobacteriales archaeon]